MEDLNSIKVLADANKAALGFVLRPALAAGIKKGWVLVAENCNQRIIGFVHYRHRQDSQTTLYEICLDEDWRGNGVGRSLIGALSDEAAILGKDRIRLKSPVDLSANGFYQALGFTLLGVEIGKQRRLNVWETQSGNGRVKP
jgi:GNAT superfamily N-acetyltransferase